MVSVANMKKVKITILADSLSRLKQKNVIYKINTIKFVGNFGADNNCFTIREEYNVKEINVEGNNVEEINVE